MDSHPTEHLHEPEQLPNVDQVVKHVLAFLTPPPAAAQDDPDDDPAFLTVQDVAHALQADPAAVFSAVADAADADDPGGRVSQIAMELMGGLMAHASWSCRAHPAADGVASGPVARAFVTVVEAAAPREAFLALVEEVARVPVRPAAARLALCVFPGVLASLPLRGRDALLNTAGTVLAEWLDLAPPRALAASMGSLLASASVIDSPELFARLVWELGGEMMPDVHAADVAALGDAALPPEIAASALRASAAAGDEIAPGSPAALYTAYLESRAGVASDLDAAVELLRVPNLAVAFKGVQMVASGVNPELEWGDTLRAALEGVVNVMVLSDEPRVRDLVFTWYSGTLWDALCPNTRHAGLLHLLDRCPYPQIGALAATRLKDAVAAGSSSTETTVHATFGSVDAWSAWARHDARPVLARALHIADAPELLARAELVVAVLNLVYFVVLRGGAAVALLGVDDLVETKLAPLQAVVDVVLDNGSPASETTGPTTASPAANEEDDEEDKARARGTVLVVHDLLERVATRWASTR